MRTVKLARLTLLPISFVLIFALFILISVSEAQAGDECDECMVILIDPATGDTYKEAVYILPPGLLAAIESHPAPEEPGPPGKMKKTYTITVYNYTESPGCTVICGLFGCRKKCQ
jgi:hypothetical protein